MVVVCHVVMKEIRIQVKIQEIWRLIMEPWGTANTMEAWRLKIEPCRDHWSQIRFTLMWSRDSDPNLHQSEKSEPNPHQNWKMHPDPDLIEKRRHGLWGGGGYGSFFHTYTSYIFSQIWNQPDGVKRGKKRLFASPPNRLASCLQEAKPVFLLGSAP